MRRGPEVKLSEDEAAYALASLLAGADGVVTHAESRRVEGAWQRFAAARGIAPAQARTVAAHCRQLRTTVGNEALLAACGKALRQTAHGKEAVRMAFEVAYTDRELSSDELAQLEQVLAEIGMKRDELPRPAGTRPGAG